MFLSDKTEYLEFYEKSMNLLVILFAAICLLILIGFILFFIWRPSDNAIA